MRWFAGFEVLAVAPVALLVLREPPEPIAGRSTLPERRASATPCSA